MGERVYSETQEAPESFPPKCTAYFQKGNTQALADPHAFEGKSIKGLEPPGKDCLTNQLIRTKCLSLEISFRCKLTQIGGQLTSVKTVTPESGFCHLKNNYNLAHIPKSR